MIQKKLMDDFSHFSAVTAEELFRIENIVNDEILHSIEAVSYTHLDVYKRQRERRAQQGGQRSYNQK